MYNKYILNLIIFASVHAQQVDIYNIRPIVNVDLNLHEIIENQRDEQSKIIYFEGTSYDFNILNNILSEGKQFTKDDNQRKLSLGAQAARKV